MSPPNVPYLRTPSERFHNLPNFPYEPHYLQYGNLRMAYVDETHSSSSEKLDSNPETFLLLHGEPTYSYLYRHMIPIFLSHSTLPSSPTRRVLAPDLLGFGRSDKPTRDADYTFTLHHDALLHFVQTLDLRNITLVVQDWGGLLGLTLPTDEPWRYKRMLVMNTTLCVGAAPSQGFLDWRATMKKTPDFPVGEAISQICPHLLAAERDAYDAPFPSQEYKAGVRRFPEIVMVSEDMDGVEISKESLRMYQTADMFRTEDVVVVCGMQDPIFVPEAMQQVAGWWRNGCCYVEVSEAGHFVQEWGAGVARMAVEIFEGKVAEGVRRVVPV